MLLLMRVPDTLFLCTGAARSRGSLEVAASRKALGPGDPVSWTTLSPHGLFVTTGSPVTNFDYSSPAPYFFLLFISFMLAMIAILTSGSSMLRWIHTHPQQTREAATLSCPTYCHSHIFRSLVPAFSFCSQSPVCRALPCSGRSRTLLTLGRYQWNLCGSM